MKIKQKTEIFLDKYRIGNANRINWKSTIGNKIFFHFSLGELDIYDYFVVESVIKTKIHLIYKDEKYTIDKSTINRGRLNSILYKTIYKEKYGKYDLNASRFIDLSNAPLCMNGISWMDCIGFKFPFHFDDIIGEVEILNVDSKNRTISIFIDGYTPNTGYDIYASDLVKCNLYNCLFVKNNTVINNRPDLITYLVNPEDAKLCVYSNKIVECKCPICGTKKKMTLNTLSTHGLRCQKCKDGISYPEKFILSLLNQLNIEYVYQLSKKDFTWCSKYFYDFYIPSINCIIETHGMQHYNGGFHTYGGKTKEQEQKNDEMKQYIALKNGIDNYISLDCRKSNIEFIKRSVINSELPTILNFHEDQIDWHKCGIDATSSITFKICKFYNEKSEKIQDISDHFKLCGATINKYLKLGTEIGICNYNSTYTPGNNRYPITVYKYNKSLGTYPSKKYIVENSEKLFGEKISNYAIDSVLNNKKPSHNYFSFKRERIS